MNVVTVVYPNSEGSRFDDAYYRERHVARIRVLWKDLLDSIELLRGKAPLRGDGPPAYHYIAVVRFKSAEAVMQAFGMPEMAELGADIANYTDSPAIMTVCEATE